MEISEIVYNSEDRQRVINDVVRYHDLKQVSDSVSAYCFYSLSDCTIMVARIERYW